MICMSTCSLLQERYKTFPLGGEFYVTLHRCERLVSSLSSSCESPAHSFLLHPKPSLPFIISPPLLSHSHPHSAFLPLQKLQHKSQSVLFTPLPSFLPGICTFVYDFYPTRYSSLPPFFIDWFLLSDLEQIQYLMLWTTSFVRHTRRSRLLASLHYLHHIHQGG